MKKPQLIRIFWLAALAVGAGAGLAGWSRPSAQTKNLVPFRFAFQPSTARVQAFAGGEAVHAAYEISVSNFDKVPIKILAVTVKGLRGGREVYARRFEGEALATIFSGMVGGFQAPQSPVLASGASGLLFLFLDFAAREATPETLATTIEARAAEGDKPPQTFAVEPVGVMTNGALAVSPPLRGSDWVAVNGPSNTSVHRRAVYVLDGRLRIAQRFAIDWVQVGKDGKTFAGDPTKNESYLAYGKDVLAVADGRVVSIKDGIPQNVPNQPPVVEINLETVTGNHVVLDLGGGRYAFYAHLIPGSLRVKLGDRVKRGQVIAHLGNTGNSTEPHLHFHLMDGPEPVNSDGLPFLLTEWTRQDYKVVCPSPGEKCELMSGPAKVELGVARKMVNESPLENEWGDFGNP